MQIGTHAQQRKKKQEVSKPLKVAASGNKFMVRTQQRANKTNKEVWDGRRILISAVY